tara:strand:+ start:428 stop:721 length:294 start_codon:yes stop_codon:yes gene_type:complete
MAQSKVITGFVANTPKYLDTRGGVRDIVISNITDSEVKASAFLSLPGAGDNTAFIVKNAVIPVGTSLYLEVFIQAQTSKIGIETPTASGVEVIYTNL